MWFLFRSKVDTSKIVYAAYTDRGSRPGENQDSLLAIKRDDFAVFCVADGLGGHSKGEVASRELVSHLRAYAESIQTPYKGKPTDLFDGFEKTIEEANITIYEEYNKGTICGTTVVVLVFCQGKFCVISAGDSRAYRKDGTEMMQITRDDVWENQIGAIDNAALNGKLFKSVGTSESIICNRFAGEVRKDDEFFICSDGIYKVVGDDYIKNLTEMFKKIKSNEDAESVLQTIHSLVDEKGAPDNNTGIIIKC